jgi:2-oxoglutarate ferredoxin oxidoreductase subunit beta
LGANKEKAMVQLDDYSSSAERAWCPGCGNFAILEAIKRALVQVELAPHQVIIFSGIGQASKLPDYLHVNAFTSLHGRPIPIAQGAHLANHGMKVIVVAGDGDTYGLGGNHFMHLMRRNAEVTLMVHDNLIYGLTKGQYSPTSPKGMVTKTSPPPAGAIDRPVTPLAWALAAGATFVARSWCGDLDHLRETMAAAIRHKGAAFLDIMQPCVTFNRDYSYDFFRPRVHKLDEEGHDPGDREAAWGRAQEWGERIPIGVVYRAEGVPTYEEQVPTLAAGPLVEQPPREWTEKEYRALEEEFV